MSATNEDFDSEEHYISFFLLHMIYDDLVSDESVYL